MKNQDNNQINQQQGSNQKGKIQEVDNPYIDRENRETQGQQQQQSGNNNRSPGSYDTDRSSQNNANNQNNVNRQDSGSRQSNDKYASDKATTRNV